MTNTAGKRSASELPDREFITLTEFITWKLDGIPRSDDEVTALWKTALDHDLNTWWDLYGPAWLKPNLELIRGGKSWPPCEGGNVEIDEINRRALAKAMRWLDKSRLTVEAAVARVEEELARRVKDQDVYAALEDRICSEAAAGRATLWGRCWNYNSRKPDSEYVAIPASFFLRRAKYSCGNGYHGKGELARWPDDDSEQGLIDSVFNKSDPPVTYLEIKISKSDAMALHAQYRSRPCDPPTNARSQEVFQGKEPTATQHQNVRHKPDRDPDHTAARKGKGGRKPGSGSLEGVDQLLLAEMLALIQTDKAVSPQAAAKLVAAKASGNGTIESKIERLAKRFRAEYGTDIARIKSVCLGLTRNTVEQT